jgi:hypothetical protein
LYVLITGFQQVPRVRFFGTLLINEEKANQHPGFSNFLARAIPRRLEGEAAREIWCELERLLILLVGPGIYYYGTL